MRRISMILVVLLASANAASAQNIEDLANDVSRTVQHHMLITYVCKDVLGSSWFHAARTISEGTIRQFGQSADEALLQVQAYEDRIKEEVAAQGPGWPFGNATRQKNISICTEQVNEAQNAARVAAARARLFIEAE